MSRGERLFGPKRNTRRNKREYRRERNEARKAKRIESEIESERDNRWERLHSEGSSGSSHRGTREEANDIYFDPLYRVGDLVMILKDTRPGVSFKSSYDKEGRVIEAIHHIPTSLSFSSSSRDFKKGSGMVDLILMRHNTIKDIV